MQKFLYVIGAVVALLIVVGLILPRHSRVEVSTLVDAPPATVYALVNDFRRVDLWSPKTDVFSFSAVTKNVVVLIFIDDQLVYDLRFTEGFPDEVLLSRETIVANLGFQFGRPYLVFYHYDDQKEIVLILHV